MKKVLFTLVASAAIAVSCAKVVEPAAPEQPVVDGVEFSLDVAPTKTVADGYSTKWVAGDEINIFNAPKDGVFAAQGAFAIDEAGLADGTFTGTIDPLEAESYSWLAVYPYAEANTDLSALALNVGGATATLATAPALAGENVPLIGAVADVAKGEAVAITMKHIASAIALKVKNETSSAYEVSEIVLTFPVAVAGAFTVNASDLDAITCTAAESAVKTITFTAAEAVSIAAGETVTFYAPIAPVTVAKDAKISYTINGEAGEITASTDVAFKAGHVKTVNIAIPEVVIPVESVGFAIPRYLLATGKTLDLSGEYTLLPEDASNKAVTFESTNTATATVNAEGLVTAVAEGDTKIIVISSENDEVRDTVSLKVAPIPAFEAVTTSTPVSLHSCDMMDYFTKTTGATIETEGQKEGTGWFRRMNKGAEMLGFNRNTAVVNAKIMAPSRAHLKFQFYMEDYSFDHPSQEGVVVHNNAAKLISRLNAQKGRLELSHAGGNGANQAIYWYPKEEVFKNLKDGWNSIDLAFKDAKILGDGYNINTEGLNWMRLFIDGPAALYDDYIFGLDDVVVYEDFSETTAEKQVLSSCDNLDGFGKSGSFYNADENCVGNRYKGDGETKVFYLKLADNAVDSKAGKANGHLHFKMYISDVTAFTNNNGQIELSSAAANDVDEIFWGTKFLSYCHNGWNDIVLDFTRSTWSDSFNPASINWFRFYNPAAKDVTVQFKDIYVYAE